MSSAASMIKDNPLKSMLQFALPLLVGNLLQQTYNIIDAAIVGQTLGAGGVGGSGIQQQCTVSGTGLLYGKLRGLRHSDCEVFRRGKV